MEIKTNLEELIAEGSSSDLASWNRPRSNDELRAFVDRRQNEIDQADYDFDFDGVLA